jgi:hypothetical protein
MVSIPFRMVMSWLPPGSRTRAADAKLAPGPILRLRFLAVICRFMRQSGALTETAAGGSRRLAPDDIRGRARWGKTAAVAAMPSKHPWRARVE